MPFGAIFTSAVVGFYSIVYGANRLYHTITSPLVTLPARPALYVTWPTSPNTWNFSFSVQWIQYLNRFCSIKACAALIPSGLQLPLGQNHNGNVALEGKGSSALAAMNLPNPEGAHLAAYWLAFKSLGFKYASFLIAATVTFAIISTLVCIIYRLQKELEAERRARESLESSFSNHSNKVAEEEIGFMSTIDSLKETISDLCMSRQTDESIMASAFSDNEALRNDIRGLIQLKDEALDQRSECRAELEDIKVEVSKLRHENIILQVAQQEACLLKFHLKLAQQANISATKEASRTQAKMQSAIEGFKFTVLMQQAMLDNYKLYSTDITRISTTASSVHPNNHAILREIVEGRAIVEPLRISKRSASATLGHQIPLTLDDTCQVNDHPPTSTLGVSQECHSFEPLANPSTTPKYPATSVQLGLEQNRLFPAEQEGYKAKVPASERTSPRRLERRSAKAINRSASQKENSTPKMKPTLSPTRTLVNLKDALVQTPPSKSRLEQSRRPKRDSIGDTTLQALVIQRDLEHLLQHPVLRDLNVIPTPAHAG